MDRQYQAQTSLLTETAQHTFSILTSMLVAHKTKLLPTSLSMPFKFQHIYNIDSQNHQNFANAPNKSVLRVHTNRNYIHVQ